MNQVLEVNFEKEHQFQKRSACAQLIMKNIHEAQQLLSELLELQKFVNKTLKEFSAYLSQKQQNNTGFPYALIKKIDLIKIKLAQFLNQISESAKYHKLMVAHKEFEKVDQHRFFKDTLINYDYRRKELKQKILALEEKVQTVESEVIMDPDFQQHKFTDFSRRVGIRKLQELDKVLKGRRNIEHLLNKNQKLKLILKEKLAKIEKQPKQQKNNQITTKQSIGPLNFNEFIKIYQAKQILNRESLRRKLVNIRKQKEKLTELNKAMKQALSKNKQMSEFMTIQNRITSQTVNEQQTKSKKITKTDYFIYLKQIYRKLDKQCKFKPFGYPQKSIIFNQFKIKRSKSQCKYYHP